VRRSGEARVAVGTLILTRRVTRPDEVLPDEYRYSQTAAIYRGDVLRFPTFNLQPSNAAGKLLVTAARTMLRLGDFGMIDFPSHAEFASRYRVHAWDAERTRWLLEDRLLAHLAGRPGLSISASNGTLLLYRTGEEIPRERWQAFADEAVEIFRLFEAAARRPSAFNDPMQPRPTDQEFFAKQMAGSGLGLKALPGVTLAEAAAFIQQPPPRAITPGIARYWKEQASPIAAIFGSVIAIGSVFFLLVGGSQVPWYAQVLLVLLFIGGGSTLIWGLVASLRARHLLQHGRTGSARIETVQTFDSRVDGSTRTRLDLQVEADGVLHRATCFLPAAAADRLKAMAAEKRPMPVLYSPGNPRRVLVAEALVIEPGLG
jgi:hypothetical protein